MRRVIWVFGESATGKSTLINEILNNENNIRLCLGLDNKNRCSKRNNFIKFISI